MPWRSLLTVLSLSLLLAGSIPATPAAAGDPGPIRLGVVTKPGASQNILSEKFVALLAASGQKGLKIEVLHSGAAGNETQIIQKLRAGQLELAVVTAGIYDQAAPEAAAVEYPFLFADYAQADRALSGPAGAALLTSLEPAGLKGLAFGENGFRHLTNNLHPVRTVADVAGLKLRVMESRLQEELWRTLGAAPVPHPWPINDFLAQGKADGQENPLWVIKTYDLAKLQKHLSLTAHVYSAHICAANLAWFNRLTPAQRQALSAAMVEAAAYQRQLNRQHEATILKDLQAAGMQVVEHPDRESFKAKAAALADSPLIQAAPVKAMLEKLRAAAK